MWWWTQWYTNGYNFGGNIWGWQQWRQSGIAVKQDDQGMQQRRTLDWGGAYAAEGEGSVFYADSGMVAYTNPRWLQTVFDMLIGIFYRVGLKINLRKTEGVVCHPFRAAGLRADKAYIRQMTGQREWFNWTECRKYLTGGSLDAHCQT